jgi:DNA-directed RNA polymerase specialized sigma24 family protein
LKPSIQGASRIYQGKTMTELAHIRVHEEKASEYASHEDFLRIFNEDTDSLYQLSFLLTRDAVKAEACFVGGIEDSIAGNSVFREWARSWAKRVIIQNAVRKLSPRLRQSDSASPTIFADVDQLSSGRGRHFAMEAVLGLEDFERFVFIMSVLEHYSEHDCALLLGCSVGDIREGRIRALKELADSAHMEATASQLLLQEKK